MFNKHDNAEWFAAMCLYAGIVQKLEVALGILAQHDIYDKYEARIAELLKMNNTH